MIQKPYKGQGVCMVCWSSFKTYASDGTIHQHGPRTAPCPGSDQPPAGSHIQPTAILSGVQTGVGIVGQSPNAITTTHFLEIEDTSEIDIGASQNTTGTGIVTIQHPNITKRLLKYIPKGARSESGRLLTNIVNAILSDPDRTENW